MGEGQSTLQSSDGGYHVISVTKNSVAESLQIEPYFDFLVGINDFATTSNLDLESLITPNVKNSDIELVFKNIRDMDTRKVKLVKPWDSLGLVLRFCSPDCTRHVYHVSRVQKNSPASDAGLNEDDYIFYAKNYKCFNDQESFFDLIRVSKDKKVTLGVYNSKTNGWREVDVEPNDRWHGSGLLGCDIGMGITHRIPPRSMDQRPPGARI
jgi:C-terminal processing protease CtpA/Prc